MGLEEVAKGAGGQSDWRIFTRHEKVNGWKSTHEQLFSVPGRFRL